jgi:hypothetical protein
MSDMRINDKQNHSNKVMRQPNTNVRLKTPVKHSFGDAMKATEKQKKDNDTVSEYHQMCGENEIKLLKQQNQNDAKIASTVSEGLGKIINSTQDIGNALKGVSQQMKQKTDSDFTQKQQKQQQEQTKTQQQQQQQF